MQTKMSGVWYSLKKTLLCKPQPSSVYEPSFSGNLSTVVDETASVSDQRSSSTCTRCLSSTCRDSAGYGSKRRPDHQGTSPRTRPNTSSSEKCNDNGTIAVKGGGTISTSERPSESLRKSSRYVKESGPYCLDDEKGTLDLVCLSNSFCQMCGEQFKSLDAFEAHHVSNHAVTHLVEGDSSRSVVEKICQIGWMESGSEAYKQIEMVLKVHNLQKVVTWFEECREWVKFKASKEPKKCTRCLADGNELMRFYGTTVACSLGMNDTSSGLCNSDNCGACRILTNGFSTKKHLHGRAGILVSSTSQRALSCVENNAHGQSLKMALLVCRVVAGRVRRSLAKVEEEEEEEEEANGFECDSLSWKKGEDWIDEELYIINPRALLPCFVVIYKH